MRRLVVAGPNDLDECELELLERVRQDRLVLAQAPLEPVHHRSHGIDGHPRLLGRRRIGAQMDGAELVQAHHVVGDDLGRRDFGDAPPGLGQLCRHRFCLLPLLRSQLVVSGDVAEILRLGLRLGRWRFAGNLVLAAGCPQAAHHDSKGGGCEPMHTWAGGPCRFSMLRCYSRDSFREGIPGTAESVVERRPPGHGVEASAQTRLCVPVQHQPVSPPQGCGTSGGCWLSRRPPLSFSAPRHHDGAVRHQPTGEQRLDQELAIAGNQEPRINDRIRAREVRLVGADGEQIGIKPLPEALAAARQQGLDLVEVADKANPPVCRIMDYGKYKYEAAQRAKDSRKKSTNIVVKEMKYRPKIGQGDFDTKTRKVKGFLEEGHKVKLTIMFRGREVQHPELGRKILDNVAEVVEDIAKVEAYPRLDGRNMTMVLGPDKKAIEALKKARAQEAAGRSCEGSCRRHRRRVAARRVVPPQRRHRQRSSWLAATWRAPAWPEQRANGPYTVATGFDTADSRSFHGGPPCRR